MIKRIGEGFVRGLKGDILFFRFVGHLCGSLWQAFFGRAEIAWYTVAEIMFRSGVKLCLPLIFLSTLLGTSLSLNLNTLLSTYHMDAHALPLALNIMTKDFVPLLIAVVICVQSALELINLEAKRLHHLPHEVVLFHILPTIIGLNLCALVLYVYSLVAYYLSSFAMFHFLLNHSTEEYLLRLSALINENDIGTSLLKTLFYCTVASLTIGYYYYEVAMRELAVRHAVSRIITRGLLWITACSVYFKVF